MVIAVVERQPCAMAKGQAQGLAKSERERRGSVAGSTSNTSGDYSKLAGVFEGDMIPIVRADGAQDRRWVPSADERRKATRSCQLRARLFVTLSKPSNDEPAHVTKHKKNPRADVSVTYPDT